MGRYLSVFKKNMRFSHHISYSFFVYTAQIYFVKTAQFLIYLFIKTIQKVQTILTHVNKHDILKSINASACIMKAPNTNASISTCIENFVNCFCIFFLPHYASACILSLHHV